LGRLYLLPPLLTPTDNAAMEAEPPKSTTPKRRRRWYQFSLRTLLIAVAAFCIYLGLSRLWHFSIAAADIVSMKVMMGWPAKEIDIPSDQIVTMVDALSKARTDWSPAKWVGIGFVRCQMKSGETIEIDLFHIDAQEMALRTDQEHYFRGADAKEVLDIIEKADQAAKKPSTSRAIAGN
jgi:hypothetical protein